MSRKNSNHTGLKVFLILLILLLIGASAFMITLSLKLPGREVSVHPTAGAVVLPTQAETEPPTEAPTETTVPEPEKVIATARISAQGDLLMHKPIFDDRSIVKQKDGSYDFDSVFKYFTEISGKDLYSEEDVYCFILTDDAALSSDEVLSLQHICDIEAERNIAYTIVDFTTYLKK